MGKATVVSGGADGSYQIKLDYGKAARDKRVTQLGLDRAFLMIETARITALLDVQQAIEDAAHIATEAAVAAYVAAGAALAPALQAVKTAEEALAAARAASYPTPEDKTAAIAAANANLTAVNAAYKAANAAIKTTLEAHAKALSALVAQKQITEGLRLQLSVPETEQIALAKEVARLQALVLEETQQAWCADLTESATGLVATIEIPGESKLILIAPQAPAPMAADGVLAAREMQSPEQLFWNAAVLPGWQKFKPTYRRGTITAINAAADTADVLLETTDKSSVQNLVINQTPALTAVPVRYMTCNTAAFKVGDRAVIKFINQDWATPRVVGFVDNPKRCGGRLWVMVDILAGSAGATRVWTHKIYLLPHSSADVAPISPTYDLTMAYDGTTPTPWRYAISDGKLAMTRRVQQGTAGFTDVSVRMSVAMGGLQDDYRSDYNRYANTTSGTTILALPQRVEGGAMAWSYYDYASESVKYKKITVSASGAFALETDPDETGPVTLTPRLAPYSAREVGSLYRQGHDFFTNATAIYGRGGSLVPSINPATSGQTAIVISSGLYIENVNLASPLHFTLKDCTTGVIKKTFDLSILAGAFDRAPSSYDYAFARNGDAWSISSTKITDSDYFQVKVTFLPDQKDLWTPGMLFA